MMVIIAIEILHIKIPCVVSESRFFNIAVLQKPHIDVLPSSLIYEEWSMDGMVDVCCDDNKLQTKDKIYYTHA